MADEEVLLAVQHRIERAIEVDPIRSPGRTAALVLDIFLSSDLAGDSWRRWYRQAQAEEFEDLN